MAEGSTSGLVLSGVTLRLGDRALVTDFSLHVAPGEIVCVMGPSGSGKSSLLRWIAGFLDTAFVASGRAELNGEDITHRPAWQRRTGIVFQDDALFPHLSLEENLAFGCSAHLARPLRKARVTQALATAQLEGLGAADPATLSGGQRARASLMRQLLAAPRAMLLDEPFGGLDVPLRAQIRAFVRQHLESVAIPALLVSHDGEDAAWADRVVHLPVSTNS